LVRFGLVGVNTSHAGVFARIFNGTAGTPPDLEGGMVVAVWEDPSAEARALGEAGVLPDARALAAAHEIQSVVADPSALIGRIDAALVVDDTDLEAAHGRLARPFVEAGIPTFVDKPMTLDIHEAAALFDLAEQHGVPLMSSSTLLSALAAITTLAGSLNNGAPDFDDTPGVIHGCSDLLLEVFGEAGRHARSAIGLTVPLNYAVEIELIVELKAGGVA
jgi:hypothetical protein